VSFLLRDTPTGALPTFLRGPAQVNHPIEFQAAPILFLASDEASYIVGSTLPVGGGDLG
jgi:dihydroxycyclohexadiene carboxylate dehydrogenase